MPILLLLVIVIMSLSTIGLVVACSSCESSSWITVALHVAIICAGFAILLCLPSMPTQDKYNTEIGALQKLCVDAGIATFTPVVVENKFTLLATGSVKAEKE